MRGASCSKKGLPLVQVLFLISWARPVAHLFQGCLLPGLGDNGGCTRAGHSTGFHKVPGRLLLLARCFSANPLCAYLALCRRESILGRKGKPATLSLQVESNGCEVLKAKMLSEASSDRATTRRLSNTMSPGCQEN